MGSISKGIRIMSELEWPGVVKCEVSFCYILVIY